MLLRFRILGLYWSQAPVKKGLGLLRLNVYLGKICWKLVLLMSEPGNLS